MNHLVGTHEIAQMLGVSRQRVFQLTAKDDFPRPTAELAMGQVWLREDVVKWAQATGRDVR
jgi:predicted DNA-binding transcriptional regulator AlpA